MGAVYIVLAMSAGFLLLGVLLLRGKGSFLISGYNTASKEEKEKYDEKKLCKGTGVVCLVVMILLWGMAYCGYLVESGQMPEQRMLSFAIMFIVLVFATVVGNIIYANTVCKKK